MSKVLVLSTSLRAKSNSEFLAGRLAEGAREAGHQVEQISLKGKNIGFCTGCLACQKTQRCVLRDDARDIADKVREADTLVFATPIYYYEMSGQMKTLLDRMNPPEKAVSGLQGWVDCFEHAELADTLFLGGIGNAGEAAGMEEKLQKAYEFGKQIQ